MQSRMGENTSFNIVVHWENDFFIMNRFDTVYFSFIDLVNQVHVGLRLDCETRLQMKGQIEGSRMIIVEDDQSLLRWFKENSEKGND